MNRLIASLIFFGLLGLGNAAAAVPAPADDLHWPARNLRDEASPLSSIRQDADVNIGPAGAMLERDYFQAQPSTITAPFLCHFEPSIFAKLRLTQSCP